MKNILITRYKRDIMREDIWNPLKNEYNVEYLKPAGSNLIKTLLYIRKNRSKWDKAILSSEPAFYPFLASCMLGNKIEKIYFPCDIRTFRRVPYKNILRKIANNIDCWFEKRMFMKADKIIHKGSEDELTFLKYYSRLKDKQAHLIREFYNPMMTQEYDPGIKLSKDGEIHLVYIGGLILNDLMEFESFWRFYPKITDQNIHLHVYSEYLSQDTIDRFREIEKDNKYFHYEGRLKSDQLIKEMRKYDYGISIFGVSSERHRIMSDVAYSLKIYDYIAACLPVICSKNLKPVADFVDKNTFGFSIDYDKLGDLEKIIKSQSYPDLIENVKIRREKLNSDKLIDFVGR